MTLLHYCTILTGTDGVSIMQLKIKIFSVVMALCLFACSGAAFYTIKLNYMPQKVIPRAGVNLQKFVITIAAFNDARAVENKNVIGRRLTAQGTEIMALSSEAQPSRAVASAVKDFLVKAGYTVNGQLPDWNTNENTLDPSWGSLAVGGSIDELEVICRTERPTIRYDARVKLRLVFADIQKRRILSTTTLESTSSLQHISFSETTLQEQLNAALSSAVEKIVENNDLERKLLEIETVRSEGLSE